MKRLRFKYLLFLSLTACLGYSQTTAENVIFVMTDGLRWQEVFHGADPGLMTKEAGGVENEPTLKNRYWRDDDRHRREVLMPFVWNVIARQGEIFGDPSVGSPMVLTNGVNFSYPGYSEALTGVADRRINSNDKVPNPNETVLEWLNGLPMYKGKVAAFAAWDVFPWILNVQGSHLLVNAGWDAFNGLAGDPKIHLLNELKLEGPRYWDEEPFDAIPFHTALQYLLLKHPRVLFLSLGETDDWAHDKRYDLYLDAAHRADEYLSQLWQAVQSMPQYKGKTALVFATDHGRGEADQWTTHGEKVPAAKNVWLMLLGPGIANAGEVKDVKTTESQIAATVAALLGKDYHAHSPNSALPIDFARPR